MKVIKYLLGIILLLTALVYVLDLNYLVNGISKTYLKGFKGPNIYDLSYFPSDTILSDENIDFSYAKASNFSSSFPVEIQDEMMAIETEYFSVTRGDSLLFEFQTDENSEQLVSNSFSMAKSFTSLCAAKAIELGFIQSWEAPIGSLLPQLDASLGQQGIGNFLAMCSGLDWSESGANPFSDNAKAYYGKNLNGLVENKTALAADIGKYEYKSGNTQIAAMAIEAATKMNLPDFFERYFWSLTAKDKAYWGLDDEAGHAKAYCCVYARGRDFHTLGQMMLDSGMANGKRLLEAKYFNDMYQPYAQSTTAGEVNTQYGIGFWTVKYQNHDIIYARGILGQYIIIVPDLDMVICRLGKKRMDVNAKHHPKDLYLYLDFALNQL